MKKKLRPSPTSFIEYHEVEDAIKYIESEAVLGAPMPRVAGVKVAVKLHVRKEEEVKEIINPETGQSTGLLRADTKTYVANDKYVSHMGVVVALGTDAYEDVELFPHGARCRVGDFVTFPRHEGSRLKYKGNALKLVQDNLIDCVIQDPSDVELEF